ncbi:TKL/DRK protein kinase [Phytophthora cinnamomi]|uniref:TKL/DRK protein kinase n=1 Tax=Phytophthora cinnamomi TaxID=4785 RepID=UPI00355AC46A|nr:TKL/DRK protein kinase [Phytophthora cinnamomi]
MISQAKHTGRRPRPPTLAQQGARNRKAQGPPRLQLRPAHTRARILCFAHTKRNGMEVPHTFVRTVKAQDLRFSQVDGVLHDIKTKNSPTWVIFSFADQREKRNTLKVLASGHGSISDQSKWPPELFSPNSLCYGLTSVDCYDENAAPTNVLSFCWKGRNLPIYLRTKYAEFNYVIRKHMGAVAHVTLHNPEELMDGSVFMQTPRRRPRSSSRRFITNDIEFTPEVTATVQDIRSDTSPFNWAVCGYDNSDIESSTQRMIVVEKGMTGLYALKGIGGITSLSTAVMLEDEDAGIRKDIGLAHGDKIHVDDKDNGENSVLAKLFEQINAGAATVSLSAERRHEVQRGVEAREAELRKILSTAAEVAVKSFRYARLTDKILGDYRQEVALLRKLKHPNIVLFIGACTDPKLMILTEYCSRKSLFEVIHSNNFETIPWKFKLRMMLDAARGIQYLHSKRIIHRDIKSHNFLVDDDWRVKVADFGISKVLDTDTAFTQCGTTGWVAPEVLLDEDLGYSFKADNWSFAIVMWEMIAGGLQNPFIGMAPIKFYNKTINAGIRPPIPEGVDSEYIDLITECWKSDAADRPSFDVIVARLEQMLLALGASIDLPPTFQGGYHQAGASANP